jgi:hypothetical protein
MALTKTISTIQSNVTVAANTLGAASTGVDLSGAVDFGIGYKMTFNGSATLGAVIELYADPEGAAVDFTVGAYDDPADAGDVAVDAGHQARGFVPLNRSAKYVKAKVRNLDTGQSITGIYLYATVQAP